MQHITDLDGRLWRMELTVGGCYLIQSQTGLDLLGIATDSKTLAAVAHEVHRIFDAIWVLVAAQAEEKGIGSQLEFLQSFDGEGAAALLRAFRAELDFFCRERRGQGYADQVGRLIDTTAAQLDLALEVAIELDQEQTPQERKARIRAQLEAMRATTTSPGNN